MCLKTLWVVFKLTVFTRNNNKINISFCLSFKLFFFLSSHEIFLPKLIKSPEGVDFGWISIQNTILWRHKYTPPHCFFCNYDGGVYIYIFIFIFQRLVVQRHRNGWSVCRRTPENVQKTSWRRSVLRKREYQLQRKFNLVDSWLHS